MDVGARIREMRKNSKLTLQQLASRAAVTAAHLSKIENGKSALSRRVLEQIAAVFDVAPSELLPESAKSATVVEKRGRSAVERYCIDWLARELYSDVMNGKPLAESGWRSPSDVGKASVARNEEVLRGLTGLGTVEARKSDCLFRVNPTQQKQNALVQCCLQIQDYRDAVFDDTRRLATAETRVNELFDSLFERTSRETVTAAILTAGWGLAIREARCEPKIDELISMGATTIEFDSIRHSAAGNIAQRLLSRRTSRRTISTVSAKGIREIWHSLPACRASRHLFCNLYRDNAESARAVELIATKLASSLKEIDDRLSLAIAGAWVSWCYLVTQGLVPHAEENRSSMWGKKIVEIVSQRFTEVSGSLMQCHDAIDAWLATVDTQGVSNEDPSDAAKIASETSMTSGNDGIYWQTLELVRFPWDNA